MCWYNYHKYGVCCVHVVVFGKKKKKDLMCVPVCCCEIVKLYTLCVFECSYMWGVPRAYQFVIFINDLKRGEERISLFISLSLSDTYTHTEFLFTLAYTNQACTHTCILTRKHTRIQNCFHVRESPGVSLLSVKLLSFLHEGAKPTKISRCEAALSPRRSLEDSRVNVFK